MKHIALLIIGIIFITSLNAQQSTTGKYRPENVSKGVTLKAATSQTIISGVPSYIWRHGCGPTALGMLVGYYDGNGYPDLIPGDASTQTTAVNDAMANTEHYDDYSTPEDSYPTLLNDKSTNGGAHTSNCLGDFMHTSWSEDGNFYGWSYSNWISYAFESYVNMQNSAYFVTIPYEHFSSESWDVFVNEINSNRPVVLLVDTDGNGSTDHFVTGIGYDVSNSTYAIYDTWDNEIHWFQWRKISNGNTWGIYGFNIFKINTINTGFDISANASPSKGGIISGVGYFDNGQTANLSATAEDGYDFVNWTENGTEVSANSNYSFTVTESRTLVANFSTNTFDITISANPSNGGTVDGGETYNNEATANLTATPASGYSFVNWTENGTEVSTNSNYSFTVTENRTIVANFSNSTSISELETNDFALFPNPTSGKVNIQFNECINNKKLAINLVDYLGKKSIVNIIESDSDFIKIDISNYIAGIYYLQIVINNKVTKTLKIVKTD